MRLDHLLSKEERSRGFGVYCLVINEQVLKGTRGVVITAIFLAAMRPGATPVPIPNTMVKARAADGTTLVTVWESRWPPDFKERAVEGESGNSADAP